MKLPSWIHWTYLLSVFGLMLQAESMAQLAPLSSPAPGQASSSTKNLLVNGSFQNGTDGWTLSSYYKIGKMEIDPTEKHGNSPALRIDNAQGDDTHLKQKVTVEPETRYRLEGYIRTKDLRSVKREGKGGAQVDLDGTWQRSQVVSGTKSWTKVSLDIVTGAETEVEVGGRLGYDPVVGTAWFADLSLVKIGKAPPRR
jgi:hypothetical protein